MVMSFLIGASLGFVKGLDIQNQREWDKGYQLCLTQLMNYRNSEGTAINVSSFIKNIQGDSQQVASID
jgi:hypothetical protein